MFNVKLKIRNRILNSPVLAASTSIPFLHSLYTAVAEPNFSRVASGAIYGSIYGYWASWGPAGVRSYMWDIGSEFFF